MPAHIFGASCVPLNMRALRTFLYHECRNGGFHCSGFARKLSWNANSGSSRSGQRGASNDSKTAISKALQDGMPLTRRHFPVLPSQMEIDDAISYAVPYSDSCNQAYMEFTVDSVKSAFRRRSSDRFDKNTAEQCRIKQSGKANPTSEDTCSGAPQSRTQLFESIPDSELGSLNPDKLTSQQLLYALGRGSMLSDPKRRGKIGRRGRKGEMLSSGGVATTGSSLTARQWQLMFLSLQKRIAELTPIELSRACQTLAYAYSGIVKQSWSTDKGLERDQWLASMEECNLTFSLLQRHIAMHANAFEGDCLSRVFYAAIKGEFSDVNGFIEFLCTEVVDRIEKMRPWHLFRIYMASTGSPSITDEFKMVLAKKLVNRLSFLPAECIGKMVPHLVEANMFDSEKHRRKINIIAGKRFRGLCDSKYLIRLGEPLVMYKLLTPTNLVALLKALMEHVPLTADPPSLPEPTLPPSGSTTGLNDYTKVLLPLKLMELAIRHDYKEVYATLSWNAREWLQRVRDRRIQLTSFAPPTEQAHINAPLLNSIANDYHLHPSLFGPYLLELSDPLTQTVVEWDKPWLLNPPYMSGAYPLPNAALSPAKLLSAKEALLEGRRLDCLVRSSRAILTRNK